MALKPSARSMVSFDEIQAVFKQIDVNNDGSLSHDEVRDAFSEVPGVEDEQIEKLIEKIDKDGSGEISLEELVETCMFGTVIYQQILMKLINHKAATIKNVETRQSKIENGSDANNTARMITDRASVAQIQVGL